MSSDELIGLPLAPPEPLRLIERAIESGYKSEDLKVLFDLYNQRTADLAREAFHRAFAAAQAEMLELVIVKDKMNPQTKSYYAPLEKILPVCKPIWLRHGFTLSFAEDDCHLEGHQRTICDVRHIAGHCVRYHKDLPVDGIGPKGNAIGGMNRIQGAVSSGTYGERILTCGIWNIVIVGMDHDGNQAQATLSHEQIIAINDLIDDCASVGNPVNLDKLLAWVGSACKCEVNSLEEVPESMFGKLGLFLYKKRRAKKETA